MGQPVERALREDGIVEEGDPLVDGPVARDEGRGTPVALEDDLVQIARLLGAEATQPEVIDDEEVGGEQSPEGLLGRVVRPGLMEPLEHAIGAEEEDIVPGAAGRMTEGASQESLPDPDGAEEDHVFLTLEEAEREEILHTVAIEGDRGVPVESLEGLLLLEAGPGETQCQVLVISAIDLVLEHELEEVELRNLRLPGVRRPVGQRRQDARELQALEHGLERLADLGGHGSRSPSCG